MKHYSNLYSSICSFEGLYQSYLKARKRKRYRNEVLKYTANLGENLIQAEEELISKSYRVSPYRKSFVYEPKKRLVMALPFGDRIVQWSVYRTLNPLLNKRYISHSYACRTGYGSHRAVKQLQYWLRYLERRHGRIYVLKADMTKYFYRVDHDIIMNILERIIGDYDLIWLLEEIVRCEHTWFGLPLDAEGFECELTGEVGIPIGNLTSQMIANLYLNELDQYAKHNLQIKYYMRYMDDVLILHNDKKYLWHIKEEIEEFLDRNLRLKLNNKTCVRTNTQGIDWIGYRVWPTHVKLRKSTAQRMKARLKYLQGLYAVGEADFKEVNATVQSYLGILKHCDSYNLREKLFGDLTWARDSTQQSQLQGEILL
ncbi:RNA-directed DNA polymerase (Reverse transcriptase) [Desulfofarcimen acetoxidans DSM 771]|uniref:RNA-directed DNA polymerase (Reverse transcriptase) n=1 Tax=Desulfofarcimen acetoxidans (strain ATCC 49208 / DSM 771 / KCTC 5769 / VKM B-1644 / 5575) TaxID=485916 RepID=C8VZI0_DESAS|nr:RNA-directed DNA polymerase [Desulfofarcimen acetoxidans]ACV64925.1 RNA-directed DNA polymerase (Reverse transcriptase) [Desulfofarcimen acetoxidans DSM 771]